MANWTGNAYVDALLLGEKWDTNNLTYYLFGGTLAWNTVETNAIQAALQSWADVANLTFTQVFSAASADLIETQNTDVAGNLGVHTVHNNYASNTLQLNGTPLTGTYNTNGYGWDENSATGGLQVGGLGYLTLVHELGHGLGLDHTHDDGGGNVNFFPGVTSSLSSGNNTLNQDVYSAMSYVHGLVGKSINGGANTDNYGFVAGPMAFDIATIQYAYGANTTQNNGNNTYILPDANAGGTYFSALWDTGGIDEIIYQGATDTVIDLRSATLTDQVGGGGFLSQTSGILGGFTIAGDFTNALTDVNGETGVIIENASGGSGSDTLTGNNVANLLNGNAGNDIIAAAGGNDTVNGGFGADTLNGDAGADILVGGADGDVINGGVGADIIYGDNLDGSGRTGTSAITLGSGTINKAGGNVSIATAQDISTQFSLGTNAEIVNSTAVPHVSVSGTGDGNVDYYKITLNNSNVTVTLDIDHANEGVAPAAFDSEISIYAANGSLIANNDDTAIDTGSLSSLDSGLSHTFVDAGTYYIAVGSYSNLSTDPSIIAAGGAYVLQVSVAGELINNNDTISGGADNDIIHASVGNDTIDGGTGIDTYDFSHDTQGASVNLLLGTASGAGIGSDTIVNIQTVVGGSGNDVLTGLWTSASSLHGGSGDDTLISGAGGGGDDLFDGGAGNDTASYASDTLGVRVSLAGQNATGASGSDTLISIENATGGSGNDTLIGSSVANTLDGGAGDDFLLDLSGGNDTLRGGAGNDQLQGGAGADINDGGADIDEVRYNSSSAAVTVDLGANTASGGDATGDSFISIENITGSTHDDFITGDAGVNRLEGYLGDDTLDGGLGADTLYGDLGFDTASYATSTVGVDIGIFRIGTGGTAQGDTLIYMEGIIGSNFADTLVGTGLYDTKLSGGAGDDLLFDYGGNATLEGGAGNDTMIGRLGADHFDGGTGTDVVRYADAIGAVSVNLGTNTASGADATGDTFTNVENLVGSIFNDSLTGDNGNNRLEGGLGQDHINGGGGGIDLLYGGADADIFVFDNTTWNLGLIIDFENGLDRIDLTGSGLTFSSFTEVDTASGMRLDYNDGTNIHSISILNTTIADIDATDFIF